MPSEALRLQVGPLIFGLARGPAPGLHRTGLLGPLSELRIQESEVLLAYVDLPALLTERNRLRRCRIDGFAADIAANCLNSYSASDHTLVIAALFADGTNPD